MWKKCTFSEWIPNLHSHTAGFSKVGPTKIITSLDSYDLFQLFVVGDGLLVDEASPLDKSGFVYVIEGPKICRCFCCGGCSCRGKICTPRSLVCHTTPVLRRLRME